MLQNFALRFWPTLGSCHANAYSERICEGFSKLYRFIFERNLESVGTFDLLLLYSFVVIFLAFLVASVFSIFEEDQRSLQQIKGKVKLSSTVIANLASALWAIKESKFKSITYEGYMRICQSKTSILKNIETENTENHTNLEPIVAKNIVEEVSPKSSKSKGQVKTANRDLSPILKKNVPSKIGISRMPTPKKVNNSTSRIRTSTSSSSLPSKSSGLTTFKSQHSIISTDKKPTAHKIGKKSVQIDESFK